MSRDSLPNPASPPLTARDPARGASTAGDGVRSHSRGERRGRESNPRTCGADEFSHDGRLPNAPYKISTRAISSPHNRVCARVRSVSYPEPESANVTSEMIVFSSSTCRRPPSQHRPAHSPAIGFAGRRQARAGLYRPGQDHRGQDHAARTGQARAGPYRTGQGHLAGRHPRTGQGHTGQGHAGQGHAGPARAIEDIAHLAADLTDGGAPGSIMLNIRRATPAAHPPRR